MLRTQHRGYLLFLADVTVEAENSDVTVFGTKVEDIQEDVEVWDDNITGTLKYLDTPGEIVDYWGAGNFLVLNFANNDYSKFSSVKVGLRPTYGGPGGTEPIDDDSGLVEIKTDPDKNGLFQIHDKDTQKFKVVSTDAETGETNTQTFDLSGLEVLNS